MLVKVPVLLVVGLLVGCAQTSVKPLTTRTLFDDEDGKSTSVVDTKIEQYLDLAKEFPDEPKYQERLGRLYMEKEDFRSALNHMKNAQKLQPDNPKFHYLEGQVYLSIGNFQRAEVAYQRMIELTPAGKYTGPYFELATLYLLEDQPVKAEKALHKCLEVDQSFPLPHYHLGELAEARNEMQLAIRHYESYLRLNGVQHRESVLRKLMTLQPKLQNGQTGNVRPDASWPPTDADSDPSQVALRGPRRDRDDALEGPPRR
ncbi:MAG: tetratricopeptide repeat protein [Planctomycetota bacterium]